MMKLFMLGEDIAFQDITQVIVDDVFTANAKRERDHITLKIQIDDATLNIFKAFFTKEQSVNNLFAIVNSKWPSQKFRSTRYQPNVTDGTFESSFVGKSMQLQMNACRKGNECYVHIDIENGSTPCCSCSHQ